MTSRRGFISSILAVASAPAIVAASSIMRVTPVIDDGVTLRYKALGRYDLDWMEDQTTGIMWKEPSTMIVPAYMANLARSMIQTKENLCAEILKTSYIRARGQG